jgi:uncharacterized sulfatase
METHLPFRPPARFVRRFAPYLQNDREAREFMSSYNKEHYRWMVPLREPLTELQDRVINDMYDAEIAYEDFLLRRLLTYVDQPGVRENTLVIITADHGEGMNHHDFVGHSLVVYDDLIRVPLIVRHPGHYPEGARVTAPISTRRIFHSVLQAAGVYPTSNSMGDSPGAPVDIDNLALNRALHPDDIERGTAFAEAYTPDTLIALMQNEDPEAISHYRCRSMRRAVYRGHHKLITIDDEPDELFDLQADPGELCNLIAECPDKASELSACLQDFVQAVEMRRPANWQRARINLAEDSDLQERLRGLGYIE